MNVGTSDFKSVWPFGGSDNCFGLAQEAQTSDPSDEGGDDEDNWRREPGRITFGEVGDCLRGEGESQDDKKPEKKMKKRPEATLLSLTLLISEPIPLMRSIFK